MTSEKRRVQFVGHIFQCILLNENVFIFHFKSYQICSSVSQYWFRQWHGTIHITNHYHIKWKACWLTYKYIDKLLSIKLLIEQMMSQFTDTSIWVRSRSCGRLVTWFCYQMIAKPSNKTATHSWSDPYASTELKCLKLLLCWRKSLFPC